MHEAIAPVTRRWLAAIGSTLLSLAPPARARAEEPRAPVAEALLAGAGSAMVPFAIGAGLAAGDGSVTQKNAGLVVANAGLCLGPLVSHAIVGEWDRGALFAAIPAASTAGIAAVLAARPGTVFGDDAELPTLFTALFAVSVLGGALGLADTALAGERLRAQVVPSRSGLVVGMAGAF